MIRRSKRADSNHAIVVAAMQLIMAHAQHSKRELMVAVSIVITVGSAIQAKVPHTTHRSNARPVCCGDQHGRRILLG